MVCGASLVTVNRWEGGRAQPALKAPDLAMLETAVRHHGADVVRDRLLGVCGNELKRRRELVRLSEVEPPSSWTKSSRVPDSAGAGAGASGAASSPTSRSCARPPASADA
ncbi:hypothetical protein SCE1572_36315 [Sorangium cellulosum So0157-2]|uniref:Uncharacterized protein n=1 Tax=Sorangium cellulosum So0157-2 TaxID=1254432 RepID=S4Y4X0_SORCE|nr:hypothetical protein SCE1572_36315 [Sorangium cellulosum So0157-2]